MLIDDHTIDPQAVRDEGAKELEALKEGLRAKAQAMTDQQLRDAVMGPAAFKVDVMGSLQDQIRAVLWFNIQKAELAHREWKPTPRWQPAGEHWSDTQGCVDGNGAPVRGRNND